MAIQRDWEQLESYIKRNTVMMQKTPYTKLYRYHIIDDYQFTNQSNSAHYLYDFDYYKEIRFLGWSYTDSGGTKHIFNANAPITRQDNGTYLITDQTGTAIAIPNGTTFYGDWKL